MCYVQRSKLVARLDQVNTVKSLLEAHALIEAHSPVWMPKIPIFQANFSQNRTSNKGPPTNIEKKWSYVMQKHLEFVISSEFLVVRLQRIVPLNKVHCFDPTFILSGKTDPT